jgi:hypothetical protein
MEEMEEIMDKMQTALREEVNKKIDICMNFLRSATEQHKTNSPATVNAIMIQEQLHNVKLTVSKVEGDCIRNRTFLENKIEQVIHYLNNGRHRELLSPNTNKLSSKSKSEYQGRSG